MVYPWDLRGPEIIKRFSEWKHGKTAEVVPVPVAKSRARSGAPVPKKPASVPQSSTISTAPPDLLARVAAVEGRLDALESRSLLKS